MKPFNLQEALAGKPVVTRDGRKVEQIFYFDKAHNNTPQIRAVISGGVHGFYDNGRCFNGNYESPADLFMAPEKKEYWINVYRRNDGSVFATGALFASEEESIMHSSTLSERIATVKVWEDEV